MLIYGEASPFWLLLNKFCIGTHCYFFCQPVAFILKFLHARVP
uniref:Uncharacterized protein n=1 Tax=Rhizophora mucronata TaxID=61149 RepID=A0A2P2NN97_RHIMU